MPEYYPLQKPLGMLNDTSPVSRKSRVLDREISRFDLVHRDYLVFAIEIKGEGLSILFEKRERTTVVGVQQGTVSISPDKYVRCAMECQVGLRDGRCAVV